ncbi:hypothetical protein CDAR_319121 [Caerostris darwini]|uniref:Uncharacterized protein n=1 Tax=Caerostris darwini TaxID=1538125 RepID=A0AAV4TWG0_9ARAC|nr:hypothetical protein CDAR_319121 [Caerostris darwini]
MVKCMCSEYGERTSEKAHLYARRDAAEQSSNEVYCQLRCDSRSKINYPSKRQSAVTRESGWQMFAFRCSRQGGRAHFTSPRPPTAPPVAHPSGTRNLGVFRESENPTLR